MFMTPSSLPTGEQQRDAIKESCPTLRLVFQPIMNARRRTCAEATGNVVGSTMERKCKVGRRRARRSWAARASSL